MRCKSWLQWGKRNMGSFYGSDLRITWGHFGKLASRQLPNSKSDCPKNLILMLGSICLGSYMTEISHEDWKMPHLQ